MRSAICLVLVLLAAACGGSFHTDLGPTFARVQPGDSAVVYAYRPAKLTTATRIVHVVVDGDERLVLVGGYAALRVAPGHHTLFAYSTPSSQAFVTYGDGPTRWIGNTSFDAKAGGEVFVRLESSIGAVDVQAREASDGAAEAASTALSPGGAFR